MNGRGSCCCCMGGGSCCEIFVLLVLLLLGYGEMTTGLSPISVVFS